MTRYSSHNSLLSRTLLCSAWAPHCWLSEFVTQSCILIYYKLWNIRKITSHDFLHCSIDQGTFKKARWQLSSKCPSSYSTLEPSIASPILTTTGAPGFKHGYWRYMVCQWIGIGRTIHWIQNVHISINPSYDLSNRRIMKLKLNRLDNSSASPFVLWLLIAIRGSAVKAWGWSINDLFLRRWHDASAIDSRLNVSDRIHCNIGEAQGSVVIFVMLTTACEGTPTTLGRAFIVPVVEN